MFYGRAPYDCCLCVSEFGRLLIVLYAEKGGASGIKKKVRITRRCRTRACIALVSRKKQLESYPDDPLHGGVEVNEAVDTAVAGLWTGFFI